jgi:predicted transcriptional regulator
MLDETTRSAILRLRAEGHGSRAIAEALGISRGAVKRVLRDGRAEVPHLERAERAQPHREQILELYASCKGNLVRVHEELSTLGAALSYPALTAFCRRHGIGYERPAPAGHYDFAPGKEMQHDTSPHYAEIAGRRTRIQTTSLALCYSRMLFFQCYPHFRRFECKVFLTDALVYFEGGCAECMIDNTHVVVLSGSGRQMVPVPEMVAFGERFGFNFVAHEIGDANRSAHVERQFDHIDNNFLAGRRFASFEDLNAQARAWCDKVNATAKRHLHASPRELFAVERTAMKPLPAFVPEVYELHHRVVDTEGYVNVRRNRYSAPWTLIGRDVEVRESKERIEIFVGPRRVAEHKRVLEPVDARVTAQEHRPPRSEGLFARHAVSVEEKRLTERMPESAGYVARLRERGRGTTRDLRWLLRMIDEYPRRAMRDALLEALHYGMTDLDRLERMVLRRIARDFFPKDDDDDR